MTDWIKCIERMPEEGQTVICYNGMTWMGFHIEQCCPYERSKKGWNIDFPKYNNGIFKEEEVTHWMPLPNPPELSNEIQIQNNLPNSTTDSS